MRAQLKAQLPLWLSITIWLHKSLNDTVSITRPNYHLFFWILIEELKSTYSSKGAIDPDLQPCHFEVHIYVLLLNRAHFAWTQWLLYQMEMCIFVFLPFFGWTSALLTEIDGDEVKSRLHIQTFMRVPSADLIIARLWNACGGRPIWIRHARSISTGSAIMLSIQDITQLFKMPEFCTLPLQPFVQLIS
jgi:hypothetical protein